MTTLTAARLREVLRYDRVTGVFIWRVDVGRWGRIKAGTVAGCRKDGYIVIRVDGVLHRANRLAWLYEKGEWPVGEVDHENGVKHENWFDNLRDVPMRVNRQNIRKAHVTNQLGTLGVTAIDDRFKVQLWVDGRNKHMGYFDTEAEATACHLAAKRASHEGCTI